MKKITFIAFSLSILASYSFADTEDNKTKSLMEISNFAKNICDSAPKDKKYEEESTELSGEGKAKLKGLVNKVFDLGIQGAGKYRRNTSTGIKILEKDLVELLKLDGTCKVNIANTLIEKFFSDSKKSSPSSQNKCEENDNDDSTEWLYGEYGHPYTTGPEPINGGDDRQHKTLTCPKGKVIIPKTPRCINTANESPISQEQIENNIYKCVWTPQRHGIGIGIEMACKTPKKKCIN